MLSLQEHLERNKSLCRALEEIKRGAHLDVILWVIRNERRQGVKVWKRLARSIEWLGTWSHFDTGRQRLLFLNSSVSYYKVVLSPLGVASQTKCIFFSHEATASDLMGPGPVGACRCYRVDGVKWSLWGLDISAKELFPLLWERQ